jgi:hypothetical protein
MNSTVETNHSTFVSKIAIIGDSLDMLKKNNLDNKELNNRMKYTYSIYEDINNQYNLDVIGILSNYYDNINSDDAYTTVMIGYDYDGKLSQCLSFLSTVVKLIDNKTQLYRAISNNIKNFNQLNVNIQVNEVVFDICICGSKMIINPENSTLVCTACGAMLNMCGIVFEDTVIYNTGGRRSIQKCYDPSKHCREWVQRIQAQENVDIDRKKIDSIIACVSRDTTNTRRLSCERIRGYLKETRNTDYNDHIPSIRYLITGTKPPQLNQEELRCLYNLFDKAIRMYAVIKPSHKSNTLYYPYILYKILDIMLVNGSRKRDILECIHLQSRDTLILNDNIWKTICDNLPDLTYRPTDRSEYVI